MVQTRGRKGGSRGKKGGAREVVTEAREAAHEVKDVLRSAEKTVVGEVTEGGISTEDIAEEVAGAAKKDVKAVIGEAEIAVLNPASLTGGGCGLTTLGSAPVGGHRRIHCHGCTTGCTTHRCTCRKHGMKCTALCSCKGCRNKTTKRSHKRKTRKSKKTRRHRRRR